MIAVMYYVWYLKFILVFDILDNEGTGLVGD